MRTDTVETTVYTFDELSEEAKEYAIKDYAEYLNHDEEETGIHLNDDLSDPAVRKGIVEALECGFEFYANGRPY